MSLKLSNKAYVELLKENIIWLNKQDYSLERWHLVDMCKYEIRKSKYCPSCYGNLEMFTPDVDICTSCKKQYFP